MFWLTRISNVVCFFLFVLQVPSFYNLDSFITFIKIDYTVKQSSLQLSIVVCKMLFGLPVDWIQSLVTKYFSQNAIS